MEKIIWLAVAIAVAGCSSPKDESSVPLKVLMIGNSFSASVLHVTPKVAEAEGLKVDFVNCNIGGCTLKTHWENVKKASDPDFRPYLAMFGTPESETAKSVRAVCNGGKTNIPQLLSAVRWDIVTIQQGSTGSAFADTYQPYADNLIATIRRHAPQAEILIQETWAYLPYHAKLAEWKMTQDEMYRRLHANYGELARRTGFRVIPTGTAVQRYRSRLPPFRKLSKAEWDAINEPNLPDICGDPCGVPKWRKPYRWEKGFDRERVQLMIDSTHLNPEGEYLQACVWLSVLFGIDARTISWAPEWLPAARAALMRDSVAEVLSIGTSAASVEERMRSRFARDGVYDFVIPGGSRDAGRIEAEEGAVRPEVKSGRLVCHVGSATCPEGAMTVRLNAPADARVHVELDWGACRTCSVSTNWADGVWTVRIAKSRDAGVPDVLSVSAESPDARRGQVAYERGVRTPPTEPNYRVFIEDWRHQRWTEAEKVIAAADGSFDLVLIGDSITHGWQRLEDGYTLGDGETFSELKRGRKVLNLGYGGDRTPDVLGRIAHGELDGYTAEYISLLIGANNRPDPKEDTAKGIRLILDELLRRHPESTILLTAILPQGKMDGRTPATLSPVNGLIRGFADGKRVRWVDFGAAVLDADGTVGSKYRDGVHLNEAGYRIWLAALLRAMGS